MKGTKSVMGKKKITPNQTKNNLKTKLFKVDGNGVSELLRGKKVF